MQIIGLSGPIGHGKTSFAESLSKVEPTAVEFESGKIVSEIVDKWHKFTTVLPKSHNLQSINEWLSLLPEIIKSITGNVIATSKFQISQSMLDNPSVEYVKLFGHIDNLSKNPKLAKQKISQANKSSYRAILQWLGGYMADNVDKGFWYNEILKRINKLDSSVKLVIVGGLRFPADAQILKDTDAVIVKIDRPGWTQPDTNDPSERKRKLIHADTTVINNGDLTDLDRVAESFISDLHKNKLKKIYEAVQ